MENKGELEQLKATDTNTSLIAQAVNLGKWALGGASRLFDEKWQDGILQGQEEIYEKQFKAMLSAELALAKVQGRETVKELLAEPLKKQARGIIQVYVEHYVRFRGRGDFAKASGYVDKIQKYLLAAGEDFSLADVKLDSEEITTFRAQILAAELGIPAVSKLETAFQDPALSVAESSKTQRIRKSIHTINPMQDVEVSWLDPNGKTTKLTAFRLHEERDVLAHATVNDFDSGAFKAGEVRVPDPRLQAAGMTTLEFIKRQDQGLGVESVVSSYISPSSGISIRRYTTPL